MSIVPQISPLLEKALQSARLKHVPAGQIVLYEGDRPQEVYVVKSGIIKLYDIDDQGNEKLLHLVRTPGVIPFAFFSGMRDPLHWFYSTLTPCDLYVIPARTLQEMARKNGALAEIMANEFSADVHELLVRLSSLSKTNARDKVVAALKFLLASHASERRNNWWRVNFPVSHQLIADLCGITRETAAITMKELQIEKIIRNPRITVLEIRQDKLITN
jgi:CRP/FNR family transcriptional regulator